MWESCNLSPNSRIASAAGRRMLKPSLILPCISPRIKEVIYRVQDEASVPLEMAVSSVWGNHRGLCDPGCPPLHRSGAELRLGASPPRAGLPVCYVAY